MLTTARIARLRRDAAIAANCTLTAITAAGVSADYDQPATAGAVRWAGASPAYLSETTERVQAGERSDVIVARTLVLLDPPATVQPGDVVTVDRDGQVTKETVRAVAKRTVTTRLVLEDA